MCVFLKNISKLVSPNFRNFQEYTEIFGISILRLPGLFFFSFLPYFCYCLLASLFGLSKLFRLGFSGWNWFYWACNNVLKVAGLGFSGLILTNLGLPQWLVVLLGFSNLTLVLVDLQVSLVSVGWH